MLSSWYRPRFAQRPSGSTPGRSTRYHRRSHPSTKCPSEMKYVQASLSSSLKLNSATSIGVKGRLLSSHAQFARVPAPVLERQDVSVWSRRATENCTFSIRSGLNHYRGVGFDCIPLHRLQNSRCASSPPVSGPLTYGGSRYMMIASVTTGYTKLSALLMLYELHAGRGLYSYPAGRSVAGREHDSRVALKRSPNRLNMFLTSSRDMLYCGMPVMTGKCLDIFISLTLEFIALSFTNDPAKSHVLIESGNHPVHCLSSSLPH